MSALYDTIGKGYAKYRKPDPRITELIRAALGDAKSAINFGAGAGSYEIPGLHVAAIEPSAEMIAQRPASLAKAVQASAENVPFDDKSFDAATAFLTTHHWADQEQGLREMKRVARKRCVIFTWEEPPTPFWLTRDYFPEIIAHDRTTFSPTPFREALGSAETRVVPLPHNCTDGFLCAYWRRPKMYLDACARRAISSFARLGDVQAALAQLERDIEDGTWAHRNASLLNKTEFDFGYRLIVADIL